MKNVTLMILEKRKSYGERLAAFLGRQTYSPFNIQLYLEHPISDEKWKKADLVLITSSLMALYGEKVKEGNVCILDESGQIIGMEGRNVYKYQSAGVIYQRLLEFCEENGWMLQGERIHGKKESVCAGIYRPVNNEKSFLKVLEMCRQKGKMGNLLYLNFETVTIFEQYMEGERKQEGLSEIIYYVKQRSSNLGMKVERMAVKGPVEYIAGAAMPMEMWELEEEDWRFCLERLCKDTKYDQILLDFGTVMPPGIVMDSCDEWYVAGEHVPWSEQLTERFLKAAGKAAGEGFSEKVKRLNVEE